MKLGLYIRKQRQACGLELSELAELAGVNKSTLFRLEKSELKPSFATLQKIANGLGIGVGELIGEER